METEIKLSPAEPGQAALVFGDELIAPFLSPPRRWDMESVYYKDPKGLLEKQGAALRFRRENGDGVCCLKYPSGGASRFEFELPAEDILSGAAALSENTDIPAGIRDVLKGGGFTAVCGCDFTRTEAEYSSEDLGFILSYDVGEYIKGELRAPLGELELELKRGELADLEAIADAIVSKHRLAISHISKLEAAMALEPLAGGESVL